MQYSFASDMAESGVHFALAPNTVFRWFQVLGERGSGTNVVRKTIFLNAKLLRTEGMGWKHGFPMMVAVPSHFIAVAVVRDAEAWAISMHKRPWHLSPLAQHRGFSDFIRAPWEGIIDRPEDFSIMHPELVTGSEGRALQLDRHPITGKPFENLFALRRAKLAALVGLLERDISVVLVRMESVVNAPQLFMERFRTTTCVAAKRDFWRAPNRRMGNNFSRSVPIPPTPKEMPEVDRAFMRSELDLDLEAALGYRYD
ncbi:MAG: hypothetical protein MK098_05795 [Marinovum sp.]|nr:hypothetical protein [Marinovum sp.]